MKRWEFERAVLRSELPAPARLILLIMAVVADWPGGVIPARFTPSLSTLAEMTGLSRRAVMNHLNAIERGGDRDGWVVRIRPTKQRARAEKERTGYRLAVPASARDALAREPDALARAGGALEVVQEVPQARAGGAHKPDPSRPSQTAAEHAQPTDDERAEVLAEIRRRKPGASEALINHVLRQEGPAILAEIRTAAEKQRLATWVANLRRLPPCEHGQPGGNQLRPDTGKPQCALCRALHRRTAA